MNEPPASANLQITADEMRRLGYRVIDRLIDHIESNAADKVTYQVDRASLQARLSEPPPAAGTDIDAVFETLERDVLSNIMHVDHPRFFAYIPGPSNFVSVMADTLAAGLNIFNGTWLASAGPTQIELVVIDWLRTLCGMPASTGGLFVSGGSMANVTALAVARRAKLNDRTTGAVVYYSDQTHASVERALRLLGFSPEQIRELPSDDGFQLVCDVLRQAIE